MEGGHPARCIALAAKPATTAMACVGHGGGLVCGGALASAHAIAAEHSSGRDTIASDKLQCLDTAATTARQPYL